MVRGRQRFNYLDQKGNPIRPSTQFIANTTDTIGITGGSPNADTDTYAFTAPSLQGYSLVKNGTADVTVGSDTISNGVTVPGNTMNIQYQGDYQAAPLSAVSKTAGVPVPVNCLKRYRLFWCNKSTDCLYLNGCNSERVGLYLYSHRPNGRTYDTLAEAVADNPTFDDTTNGCCNNDNSPQPFTVNYTADNMMMVLLRPVVLSIQLIPAN